MRSNLISITEVVKKFNLPYSTVNHYTVIGLLNIAGRRRNIRLYDEQDVRQRLEMIASLRSKGYPLHLIQQKLNNK